MSHIQTSKRSGNLLVLSINHSKLTTVINSLNFQWLDTFKLVYCAWHSPTWGGRYGSGGWGRGVWSSTTFCPFLSHLRGLRLWSLLPSVTEAVMLPCHPLNPLQPSSILFVQGLYILLSHTLRPTKLKSRVVVWKLWCLFWASSEVILTCSQVW